ncbi:MAG: replication/maintenance protein RepL [Bacteroidota bacterium]
MAKKNEMGLTNYPFHSSNPFLSGIVDDIVVKKTRKAAGFKFQDVVDQDTGEVNTQTMLVLSTRKEVDKSEFAKVFRNQFAMFYGLSKSSLDLMDYISDNIRYNNDRICIVIVDVVEQKKMGYSTVYRSITQLIEKKLLAKADMTGCYYINPQIFFKGDRIILLNEYIKKDAKNKPLKSTSLVKLNQGTE